MFHVACSVSPASACRRRLVAVSDGGRDAEEEMGVPMQRWRALMRGLDTRSETVYHPLWCSQESGPPRD